MKTSAGDFHADVQHQSFIRLNPQDQLVVAVFKRILPATKQRVWWLLESNGHFGHFGRQALSGSHIKRHARPTPVVDVKLQRRVGFGFRVVRHAFFFAIAFDRLAFDHRRRVLPTNRKLGHVLLFDRPQRFEQLTLFFTNRNRVWRDRRFHRHVSDDLHQVILQHVSQRTRLVVVPASRSNTNVLRIGDLDMMNVIAIPQRFKNAIGKTSDQ